MVCDGEVSSMSSELLLREFTPATMPMTAATSRRVEKRAKKSFLRLLEGEGDVCNLPESCIPAKSCLESDSAIGKGVCSTEAVRQWKELRHKVSQWA